MLDDVRAAVPRPAPDQGRHPGRLVVAHLDDGRAEGRPRRSGRRLPAQRRRVVVRARVVLARDRAGRRAGVRAVAGVRPRGEGRGIDERVDCSWGAALELCRAQTASLERVSGCQLRPVERLGPPGASERAESARRHLDRTHLDPTTAQGLHCTGSAPSQQLSRPRQALVRALNRRAAAPSSSCIASSFAHPLKSWRTRHADRDLERGASVSLFVLCSAQLTRPGPQNGIKTLPHFHP